MQPADDSDLGDQCRPSPRIQVHIVEDDEIQRRGLEFFVETEGLEVIPSRGIQSLEIEDDDCRGSNLCIKAIITSTDLAASQIATIMEERAFGDIWIVLLRDVTAVHLNEAVKLPADGFLSVKSLRPGTLTQVIREAARGDHPMPPGMSRHLIESGRRAKMSREILTPRELDVLRFMGAGFTNLEIARQLRLSCHVVKRHVESILAKLHSPNRTAALAASLREGILVVEELEASLL